MISKKFECNVCEDRCKCEIEDHGEVCEPNCCLYGVNDAIWKEK